MNFKQHIFQIVQRAIEKKTCSYLATGNKMHYAVIWTMINLIGRFTGGKPVRNATDNPGLNNQG